MAGWFCSSCSNDSLWVHKEKLPKVFCPICAATYTFTLPRMDKGAWWVEPLSKLEQERRKLMYKEEMEEETIREEIERRR